MCDAFLETDAFVPSPTNNSNALRIARAICSGSEAGLGDAAETLIHVVSGLQVHIALALLLFASLPFVWCMPTFKKNSQRKVALSLLAACSSGICASVTLGVCTLQVRNILHCDVDDLPFYAEVLVSAVGFSVALVPGAVCVLAAMTFCSCRRSVPVVRSVASSTCSIQCSACIVIATTTGMVELLTRLTLDECGRDYGAQTVGSLDLATFATYASALSSVLVIGNLQALEWKSSPVLRRATVVTDEQIRV